MKRSNGFRLALFVAAATLGASEPAFAQGFAFAPHRAIYELTLDPSKPSSRIEKATGRIAYEMTGNACVGYSMTLRQVTRLNTGGGRESVSDLRSVTWEAGDATSYRFKTQNYLNQELRDDVDGTAERTQDRGFAVRLTKPEAETLTLDGPLVLPTEHLRKLIESAEAGGRILEARVYDGAPDGKKVYDTLAVIGMAISGAERIEEAAKAPELADTSRYPITISYFEPGTGERTPAYVLGFELYENGVSRALRLDYGGFALRGELNSVEFFKPVPCEP